MALLLWFRLGTLTPGLSTAEVNQANSTRSLQKIVDNPIGLPHKVLQYGSQRVKVSPFTIRTASALIGLFTVACFYYVVKSWYTTRMAVLGTLLFATSPWLLNIVRYGASDAMYLLLFATVACVVWMQNSGGSIASVLFGLVLIIALLYIPGMIWFVIPVSLWQLGRIGRMLESRNAGMLTLLSLFILGAVAPIGWAIFQDPSLAKTYFGLPQSTPDVMTVLRNLADLPVQLFWQGPDSPETWLARVPLLNWLISAMLFIGLYAYFFKRKLDRTPFIIFVGIFGSILIAVGGPVNFILLMPFIYLIAVGGMALMLQQWFTVFPRNPFARSTGALLLTSVVILATFYNINQYFIAWPNAPETKQVMNRRV